MVFKFSPCPLLLVLLLFPLLIPRLRASAAAARASSIGRPMIRSPPSPAVRLDSWRGCKEGGDGWGRAIPGRGGITFSSMEAPGNTSSACSSARHFWS